MTVSTTPSIEFSRDRLLRLALQTTGAFQPSDTIDPARIQQAADMLELELDSLQLEGRNLRAVERTTLDLIDGTQEYTLPADTLGVVVDQNGVCGTIIPTTNGNETIVTSMSLSEYMTISTKALANSVNPARCFIERKATVKLVFWPIPNSSTAKFRYSRIKFLASAGNGANTLDVPRPWQDYLMYAVAERMVYPLGLPLDRAQALGAKAASLRAKCLETAPSGSPAYIHITHSGRNW